MKDTQTNSWRMELTEREGEKEGGEGKGGRKESQPGQKGRKLLKINNM